MERYCSTGQSPQRAVAPTEEDEEEEEEEEDFSASLHIFERKIFRRIYGPKYEDGEWKSRTNRELEKLSKGEYTVKWIKRQRISWLGHLERIEEDRMPKNIFTQTWKGRDEEEDSGKGGEKK
jgi:hypothetical protein